MHVNVVEKIDWVGHVDWTVRDFHGYETREGSTYNAYLVRDEKTALIDTVKEPFAGHLLANVRELTDPGKVDYIVCNHAEPDHSGAFQAVLQACRNAQVVCTAKCRKALSMHFDTSGWRFLEVEDGGTLSLGERTLAFVETPMAHWPESTFTYVPEQKVLFSMDAFGQHFASSGRFDDEEPLDVIMHEAKTYYANIIMPYGRQVAAVLEKARDLEINVVATSHGIIWRTHIDRIVSAYKDWAALKPEPKMLVVYDTMWGSTAKMAEAVLEGASGKGLRTRLFNVRRSHITELATEVIDAAAVAFGTPTLNRTMMPGMAAAMTYLKGLRPLGKAAFAFGSYGWAKGGARELDETLREMRFEVTCEPIQSQFAPTDEVLDACRQAGAELANRARHIAADAN